MQTTALHALHQELGAKLVTFAGWVLPVHFAGGIAEHQHTRTAASLFDVSHMGQVLVRPTSGQVADAAAALETLIPASIVGLAPWRQRYGLFTSADGGVLDDLMIANHSTHFFLVVNAARTEHDLAHLRTLGEVKVEHVADRSLLALQGPRAEGALTQLIPEATRLVFMDSVKLSWDGTEVWVSRSGYTGEDGFEISLPNERAEEFARRLLDVDGVAPAGLGARDSLRLEAGMPLYGHDLTDDINPVEAGLAFAIPKVRRSGGSRAGGFPGADVIVPLLDQGSPRERVGLRAQGRAPVREGAPLFATEDATEPLAVVTSGGFGPSVGGPIAMAMLPRGTAGTVYAEVRGRRLPLSVTDLPFIPHQYKR